ncbi:unnamed protein product [Prorocentrum cordatum]|uniref:Uncharacterized protein n=1 Tax=Prorocentrum cordatum TaxID=2364126 RepID=A0ABN9WI64_9DINO|nr:unnamed protein product [Polarella glacialis]
MAVLAAAGIAGSSPVAARAVGAPGEVACGGLVAPRRVLRAVARALEVEVMEVLPGFSGPSRGYHRARGSDGMATAAGSAALLALGLLLPLLASMLCEPEPVQLLLSAMVAFASVASVPFLEELLLAPPSPDLTGVLQGLRSAEHLKGWAANRTWRAAQEHDALANLLRKVVRSPEKRRAWESELRGGALNDAMAASRARVRLPTSGDDEVSRICFQVAFFKENAGGFDLLTDENVGAFVQACREVFGQMEEEVKERLGSMLEQGRLQHAVYERGALVKRPPNDDTCADAFPFKTHEELVRELGHEDAMVYQSEGVQVRKERVIPLSEVQAAFARGEVARVDATQLLPGWLLNASLPDLAARYPTAAKTAPCNGAYIDDEPLHHREPGRLWFHYGRSQDCHSALEDFTNQFPVWGPDSPEVQMGLRVLLPSLIPRECKSYPTLAEIASWTASFGDSELGRSVPYELFFNRTLPLETKKEFKRTVERHQALPCCQVNARRLPGFPEALNFAEKLGVGHVGATPTASCGLARPRGSSTWTSGTMCSRRRRGRATSSSSLRAAPAP